MTSGHSLQMSGRQHLPLVHYCMQEAQVIEPELVGMIPFCGVHVKLNHQNLLGTF